MNLREAIAKIDKTDRHAQCWVNMEDFRYEFDIHTCYDYDADREFEKRVKKYWIHSWNCTDTWVGLAAYFFDDELVAVSYQSARKDDETFDWVSKEAAIKLRDFIVELNSPARDYKIVNLDEDMSGLVPDDGVMYSVLNLMKENNG